MDLTIGYCTSRKEPLIEYFFDSLAKQIAPDDQITIIVVDYFKSEPKRVGSIGSKFAKAFVAWSDCVLHHVNCKPTIWQGVHQLPREPWWAKSAYLNTIICLCRDPFVAFIDDRSALSPGWLDAVRRAMEGNYAVCGSYEKHAGLIVENGEVKGSESLLGADTRTPGCYPFDSYYGGSGALPLEWCLMVNGFSEDRCDSLGSEDSMFGVTLRNNNLPIRYDSEMRLIEDRTPGQIDGALKRADKNSHLGSQAKSWAIVRAFHGALTSGNSFDIRNLRDRILLNGESLDSIKPSTSDRDWYDGQKIEDFV